MRRLGEAGLKQRGREGGWVWFFVMMFGISFVTGHWEFVQSDAFFGFGVWIWISTRGNVDAAGDYVGYGSCHQRASLSVRVHHHALR